MKKEPIDIFGASAGTVNPLVPDVAQALCFISRIKGMNAEVVPPDFPISPAPT